VRRTGAQEALVSSEADHTDQYDHPSGGWGSLKSLGSILLREHVALHGPDVLMHQNKPDGYACVSCAWAKPAAPHRFEFCENGAKATAWEITPNRAPPAFFLEHPARELESWRDHDLEEQGRLTAPLRWDAAGDRYVEVTWASAFEEIARELRALPPKEAVFYTSGRASLEASYLYATPTCRASAPSASPRSPSWRRSTSSRSCTASRRRARRG
jgi:anaerobic selenocysteine-containing dehydrogenase